MEGKIALVTGSGTGIGRMIAEGFAKNGAKVYITGRRKDVLQKTADQFSGGTGKIIPLVMDVTDPQSIAFGVQVIAQNDGKLDVLVNNAGISRPLNDPNYLETKMARVAEGKLPYDVETFEGFESIFKLNISAPYFVSVAFIDLLVKGAKSGEGTETANIINVSSSATEVKLVLIASSFSYSLSKAALDTLTIQLAASFARQNLPIRVNCILSGAVKTDILPEEFWEPFKTQPLPGLIEPIPLRRFGTEEEMAKTALYLATTEYVNGAKLSVHGGVTLVNP